MDWKIILALAVLAALAHCEMNTQSMKHNERIACIQAGGNWGMVWGAPSCTFSD
jgi:hypothetical protein